MKVQTTNATERYSTFSISLHWLMLLLFIAVYACIELRVLYPRGSDPREALKTWHFMLGLSVFLLVWIRLIGRMIYPQPAIIPRLNKWQQLASKGFHWLLYAFMIGMPLLGWLLLSAEQKPIPFFGLELPALVGKNDSLADTIKYIHETVGAVGYFAIGIHAIAALVHHYIMKDNTLARMLPKPIASIIGNPSASKDQSGQC